MPMVAAAAAAAVTWVTTTATAALTSTLFAVGVGKASFAVATAIVSAAGQLAASAALTALMQPQVGAGGSPTAFKADPAAPISGVMGRFGVGGRQLHGNVWGKGNLYLSFATALSLGPISGVAEFKANDTVVTFPGPDGLAADVEPYRNKMWQTFRLGLPTDAALSPPSGVSDGSPAMSEWTAAHTVPMVAHSFWTLKNNSKRASFEGGVPRPLWTLLGMLVWDPRLDSTYPGGSGSQRRDDWTTWGYSENPQLHALAWARGHHKLNTDGSIDRTKRLAGIGAPDSAIDIATLVEGANISDANGWKISGEWTTSDDKWQTFAAMLQAGGAVPLNRGAMIGCMTEAPRASILTLTQEDIVGPVRIGVMASRRDRPNTIIPRYRSEPHKWEEVPAGAVSAATYVTEDRGEPRTREVSYRYVRQAKQAAELAAYDLANARETLRPSIPAKPYMLGLRAGDAFTVEAPETGMNGQKVVLMRRPFDPASAVVTLECRSETDAKHPWALGQVANPPASPTLTAPDRTTPPPAVSEWAAAAGTITGDDGAEVPALVITGAVSSEVADQVIFEYRRVGATDWVQAGVEGPEVVRKQIVGLAPGSWEAAISYRANGNTSTRLVLDPVALGAIVVPLTTGVLDDADVMRRPGGGGLIYTGDLDAVNGVYVDNAVGTLESELLIGTVIPAEAATLTGEGPLAKSSLSEDQVRGRYLGEHAGDAAANTAGMQNGDLYVDTSLWPKALKVKSGGVIAEVDTSGLARGSATQYDLTSGSLVDVASKALTNIQADSFVSVWCGLKVELTPSRTRKSGGTAGVNPSGTWQIVELPTAGGTSTVRASGSWSAIRVGDGPNPDYIADFSIDGSGNVSDVSKRWRVANTGDVTWKLQMALSGSETVLDFGADLLVQIQRNPAS